jgi:heme-degrading monooxygenase HmoA
MFLILWEFEVKPGEEVAFEKVYGPEGLWVQLFRGDPRYRETKLLKDPSRSGIYFTLDFWESENDYNRFKQTNQEAYAKMDKATESLTIREQNLGCFLQREPEPTAS